MRYRPTPSHHNPIKKSPREAMRNAAGEVPPFLKWVLARKAHGAVAYWMYTKGAHRA